MLLLKTVLSLILSIWLAATLAFFALRLLPGNAIDSQLQGSGLVPEVIAARKAEFGLDKPIIEQYLNFLWHTLQGDLGLSLYTGQSVNEIIAARLPNSLSLATLALCFAIIFGIGFGIISALKIVFLSFIARFLVDLSLGIPLYLTATILLFSLSGRISGIQTNLFLPVAVLAFHSAGSIARIIELSFSELQNAAFVQTARAKGLAESLIIWRHILRLALLPAIPVIGVQTGILFSGTVITETIFGRAGLGMLLLDAVIQRNYPVVQAIVILAAIFYLLANAIADLMTQWLDPRVRLS